MKRTTLWLIMCAFCQLATAQISDVVPFSPSIAQTSVADTRCWTAFNNPAMLGYIEQGEFGVQLENRYFITDLSTKSVQAGIITKPVKIGLSFSHFGYSLYHEMLVGMGFARNFAEKFSMGVQFNYFTSYFSSTNTYHSALLAQVGLAVQLSPNFNVGFNTFNPFQTNIQTELVVKKIPSVFSIGTAYYFSPELVWRTQADKEVSSNYRFATGFEYGMTEEIQLKLGAYATDYLVPCIGFGYELKSIRFDLNCELHPLLGINTLGALKYRF